MGFFIYSLMRNWMKNLMKLWIIQLRDYVFKGASLHGSFLTAVANPANTCFRIICQMIKQVSDFYGTDSLEWIKNYAKLVIEEHKDDFSRAIMCFEDLIAQTKYARRLGST